MMKTAAKRVVSCLLLLLAAMPLIYTLVVGVQQQSIREKMKVQLGTHVLQSVTIPVNEVHWIMNGKEIWINGRMFDIRSSHFQNGEYVFSGLYDEDETVLLKQSQKEEQNNSSENKLLVQFFQFLQSFYHNSQQEFVFYENITCHKLNIDTPDLHSGFISIFSPPPQV